MSPSRRERVRYVKPTGIVIGAMVLAHARALAFVSFGSSTGWSAFLLSAIGLQNVDFAPSLQSTINEVVEPGGGELPTLQVFVPCRVRSSVVTYPRAIAVFERYAEEDWGRTLSPDHRNAFLIPDRFHVGQFGPPKASCIFQCNSVHNAALQQRNLPDLGWLLCRRLDGAERRGRCDGPRLRHALYSLRSRSRGRLPASSP